jgi:hypothetical protein
MRFFVDLSTMRHLLWSRQMKKCTPSLLALLLSALAMHASAQVAKIKDGDKLTYASADYAAKGREIALEGERIVAIAFTEKDGNYTNRSEQGASTFVRKTHVRISRETPQGVKTDIPADQQHNWMPPGGDFTKPWPTSFGISHPQCGNGKVTHEAIAKPVKYTVQIGGKPLEVAAFEVNFNGKWDFNNQCRSGKQVERWIYSPELDLVVELDIQSFTSQGFLNRGTNSKLKSVN